MVGGCHHTAVFHSLHRAFVSDVYLNAGSRISVFFVSSEQILEFLLFFKSTDQFTADKENGNPGTGIQVYIGNESPMQGMKDCSVVTATYDLGKGMREPSESSDRNVWDYKKWLTTCEPLKVQLDDIFKKTDE